MCLHVVPGWNQPQSYHIYEAEVEGGRLRQLTHGPKNDCEPFYLPTGQIGFTSDRPEHFVMCGGDRHVANLVHSTLPDLRYLPWGEERYVDAAVPTDRLYTDPHTAIALQFFWKFPPADSTQRGLLCPVFYVPRRSSSPSWEWSACRWTISGW